MTQKTLTLIAAVVALFGVAACAQRATDLPPGKYESSSKSVDSQGTAYTKDSETEVEVDEYGNKTATSKTTTSKDPEGLFNKSSTTQKTTVQENR